MKDTEKRRPGRPVKYDEPIKRVQLHVFERQHEAAEAEAAKRGVSLAEVYREWIEIGRRTDRALLEAARVIGETKR